MRLIRRGIALLLLAASAEAVFGISVAPPHQAISTVMNLGNDVYLWVANHVAHPTRFVLFMAVGVALLLPDLFPRRPRSGADDDRP